MVWCGQETGQWATQDDFSLNLNTPVFESTGVLLTVSFTYTSFHLLNVSPGERSAKYEGDQEKNKEDIK